MKLQMKFRDSASFHGFRFKSAIPRIPRSRKITGPILSNAAIFAGLNPIKFSYRCLLIILFTVHGDRGRHLFKPVLLVGGATKKRRYGKLLQNTEIDSQNTESLFMGCTGLTRGAFAWQ